MSCQVEREQVIDELLLAHPSAGLRVLRSHQAVHEIIGLRCGLSTLLQHCRHRGPHGANGHAYAPVSGLWQPGAFARTYSCRQMPDLWKRAADTSTAIPGVASLDGSRVAQMTSNVTAVMSRSICCTVPGG